MKSNNKFTLPFHIKEDDLIFKEKDQMPEELIQKAKEEIVKGLRTQANLKEVSQSVVYALRRETD